MKKLAVIAMLVVGLIALVSGGGVAFATHPGTVVLVEGTDTTSDGGGCGDVTNPCDTIQAAIAHANAGDEIQVASGTYAETGQIVINKNLSIVGDLVVALFSIRQLTLRLAAIRAGGFWSIPESLSI